MCVGLSVGGSTKLLLLKVFRLEEYNPIASGTNTKARIPKRTIIHLTGSLFIRIPTRLYDKLVVASWKNS